MVRLNPPVEAGGPWSVTSADLSGWGAANGMEVEERVRELVAARAPELGPLLEYDSYPESFVAYAYSELDAAALMKLCGSPPARG